MQFGKILFFGFCFLLSFHLQAQEELGNLWHRGQSSVNATDENNMFKSSREDEIKINYLYSIRELPFIDDFTTYKVKVFVTDTNDPSVFDSTAYAFLADGIYQDSLAYKSDTVYNYVVNPLTQKLDSTKAKPIQVDFYADTANPFTITNTEYYFPSYSSYTQNGVTRIIDYTPDSVLQNKKEKHYFAYDDNETRWITEGAFWNKTMGIDPPTVGVVTFDGLNEDGYPYDITDQFAYGAADVFTSKPINLFRDPKTSQRYTSADSVYLSFFFQPFGNGDQPEVKDSLLLDFYSPTDNRWYTVWSKMGSGQQDFEQVYIHLADTKYLQLGFQFRFRNFASLSGNFDHWHIDYVRLDKGRSKNDKIDDFAFINPFRTMLNHYTSMPWRHYKSDPYAFVLPEMIWRIKNLGPNTDFNVSQYKVYLNGQRNPFFKSDPVSLPSVPSEKTEEITHSVSSAPNNFIFPTDTNDRQLFEMRASTFSTQDVYRDNDTLLHLQLFDNFYAYDDGSAEKTYQLNLVGTSVAVQFKAEIEDTLRAIQLNFVETFEVPTIQQVNLLVYKDLESDPIYQSGPIDVIYKASGKFHRYEINPLVLEGNFYIGYQQLSSNKTYVGYDVNYNNQNRTFISQIGGSWTNSIFPGTVMIRADFGDGTDLPLSDQTIVPTHQNIELYPNPTDGVVRFNRNLNHTVRVLDLNGSLVYEQEVNSDQMDLSHLDNGFYFVQINQFETKKLIISH